MGVLALHVPLPFSAPLFTVPLPVNATTLPFASPATKSRLNAPSSGTGFAATPTRTPWPALFGEVDPPVMEPCPLLLFAIKQTGPATENDPTGVVTLQGLETNCTW